MTYALDNGLYDRREPCGCSILNGECDDHAAMFSDDCSFCRHSDHHDQDEHDAQIEQERIRIFGRDVEPDPDERC